MSLIVVGAAIGLLAALAEHWARTWHARWRHAAHLRRVAMIMRERRR